MSTAKEQVHGLKLIGGALCVDFTNTTGWRPDPGDEEYLRDYEDLLAWSEYAGGLDEREVRTLTRVAKADPEKAKSAHWRAIALRETLYRVLSSVAAVRDGDATDIDLLNKAVLETRRHLRLASTETGFAWEWQGAEGALELPLWRVARSAADLLVSSELARVRECSGDRCDWLFLDASKNRSRRWCDMANCGNRAKAKRSYARRKEHKVSSAAREGRA